MAIIVNVTKGATGDVLLTFRGEFTRFEDPEDNRLGQLKNNKIIRIAEGPSPQEIWSEEKKDEAPF